MPVFSQDSAFLERYDIQFPENFAERGAGNRESVISQQFTLNPTRAESPLSQFGNPSNFFG
jgi:hypothetical protein